MRIFILLGAVFVLFLNQAQAMPITFIEASRPDAGPRNVSDFTNIRGGFQLTNGLAGGTLSNGDIINIFGAEQRGTDRFTIRADDDWSFIITGLEVEKPGSQLAISLLDQTTLLGPPPHNPLSTSFFDPFSSGSVVAFDFGPGVFSFEIFQSPRTVFPDLDAINYDFQIVGGGAPVVSVPEPEAVLFMLIGFATLVALRRCRKDVINRA